MDWTPWLKFIHVAAGFAFALAHGSSAFTSARLRRERDPARITALLDLSRAALPASDLAILLLLISGVVAGFTGSYWGHAWIWVSIGVLVFLFIYMGTRAVRYSDTIRHALGLAGFYDKKGSTPPPPDPAALTKALDSPRGMELAAVGFIGLALILWLMVVKPF